MAFSLLSNSFTYHSSFTSITKVFEYRAKSSSSPTQLTLFLSITRTSPHFSRITTRPITLPQISKHYTLLLDPYHLLTKQHKTIMSTTTPTITPSTTPPDVAPIIDQTLNRIDFALQRVYNSQETLGSQLDQIEALIKEFNELDSPSVQGYIEKILKVKEIIESTQARVDKLSTRAEKAKQTIREKHHALRPVEKQ